MTMAFRIPVYTRAEVEKGQKQWLMFFSVQLILQFTKGSNGFITEKTILFQGSRGGPTFSKGSKIFRGGGGGPNANFYRYPYNF